MQIETPIIIFDENLEMDVNTGIIGHEISKTKEQTITFPTEELLSQIDNLENAIYDLESSFDSSSTSRLSYPNRQGIYQKAGLLTNIVLGIIIMLIFIILLV